MDVSIIIPVLDQHELLVNTLAGIDVQIALNPALEIELLLVDNGSSVPVEEAIPRSGLIASIIVLRSAESEPHLRLAAARNQALQQARGDLICFLDADCCPGPGYLREHWQILSASSGPTITIGHRVFVDGRCVDPELIRRRACDLSELPYVASESNYGLTIDRRLEELQSLDTHPMPYNCCHGCNIWLRSEDLRPVEGFDTTFDGYWGYEDIEFCYRMWKSGARIVYAPEGYVYHQEGGGLSADQRRIDRRRNYRLACARIPGFHAFRQGQARIYYEPIDWEG